MLSCDNSLIKTARVSLQVIEDYAAILEQKRAYNVPLAPSGNCVNRASVLAIDTTNLIRLIQNSMVSGKQTVLRLWLTVEQDQNILTASG